jgi:glycosyltransferase involved in cell wall biosynthesis
MLCGRPVLATDVGGHAEWIEDGVQGYIAAAPTAAALHKALQAAWSDLPHWEQRGRAAHEKAMQLYDPAPGVTLLKLIEEMLPQRP